MKIELIAFTKNGAGIAEKLCKELTAEGHSCNSYGLGQNAAVGTLIPLEGNLSEWTASAFDKDALIFVGAAGIAVRAIAPYVRGKTVDPAVIVVDEGGRFAIPILSGHIGGANLLADRLAEITGGTSVITTATDLNNCFAVDVWATEQGLHLSNMKAAKRVSAEILASHTVYIYSQYPLEGEYPKDIVPIKREMAMELAYGEQKAACIVVSHESFWENYQKSEEPKENLLQLIPRAIYVGMGCRKGVNAKVAEEFLSDILKKYGIKKEAVAAIASVDLKKEEEALITLSEKLSVPFLTYSAEELLSISGEFTASQFVEQTTGVNNVCERAAIAAAKGGHLILRKEAGNGITVALAMNRPVLSFR